MPSTTTQHAAPPRSAAVWDLPVRLFHWLLVALLGVSWWTGKHHAMEWHRRSGYAIITLLVFRIYWGFAGGRTARFGQFIHRPRVVLAYLRTIGKTPPAATGHNPVGGWSVALVLSALLAMVIAGLFAVDVDGLESGPLADHVSFDQGRAAARIHAVVFDGLLVLAVLHVAAILFYLLRHRTNLIGPMITGRRRTHPGERIHPLGASRWKAGLGIVLAASVAAAIANDFTLFR